MTYEIRLSGDAEAYLRRLDEATQERIRLRLAQIASNPFGPQTKALTSTGGLRSARVGGNRILFRVDRAAMTVGVSVVGPRGQVYRDV
jgi:mRNA interferase RelE/StbE